MHVRVQRRDHNLISSHCGAFLLLADAWLSPAERERTVFCTIQDSSKVASCSSLVKSSLHISYIGSHAASHPASQPPSQPATQSPSHPASQPPSQRMNALSRRPTRVRTGRREEGERGSMLTVLCMYIARSNALLKEA